MPFELGVGRAGQARRLSLSELKGASSLIIANIASTNSGERGSWEVLQQFLDDVILFLGHFELFFNFFLFAEVSSLPKTSRMGLYAMSFH